MFVEANNSKMDVEWLQLIIEAKNLGIEKKDIRKFLINRNHPDESQIVEVKRNEIP